MNPARVPASESAGDPAVADALRALDRAVVSGAADRIACSLAVRRRARRNRRIVAGTAAACVVATLLLLRAPTQPVVAPGGATIASARVFVPTRQVLWDGSVAESKPGADFSVEFTAAQRRIVLRAGEAHFAVQKDAARPFVVVAGEVQVRAIGTAFSVERSGSTVAVLVTEGRVAVNTPAAAAPVELGAGERAVVAPAAPAQINQISSSASAAHLGWRVPRIEFSATPLSEAIPLFNRHAGTRLALDPALGGLRLSGALRTDDLDALLLLLRGEFGVAAESQPDGTIALRRR